MATQETVGQLAQAQGLPAPPITPAGATVVGANPDQAKMMGTPAQKAPALQLSQQAPGATLRGAQQAQERAVAAGAGAGAEEAQTKEKSQQLAQLQGLGDRVQNLITTQASTLTNQMQGLAAKEQFGPETVLAQGYQAPQLTEALNKISTAGTNQQQAFEGLVTVNQALGRNPDAPITPEDLKNLYQGVDQSIVDSIVQQMPDKILVSPEMAASLGYQDSAQLEGLLGLQPGQLANMSVQQLQDQVETAQTAQFDKVSSLRERANDPNLSGAERQAITQELRSMGATGLRASEEDVANTVQAVETADEVEFGGQTYALADLLDDDKFSGVLSAVLEDPEGKLMKSLPEGLQQFITDNRAALADASEALDVDTQEFGKLTAQNLDVANFGVGPEVSADVTSTIFGAGWDQKFRSGNILDEEVPGTGKTVKDLYPGFELLKGNTFDDASKANIVGSLNDMAKFDPELAKQVLQLSADELRNLGISSNSEDWRQFLTLQKQARALKDVDSSNLDAVLDTFMGKDVDANALSNSWREAWAYKQFGLGEVPGTAGLEGILGSDGKLTAQSLYDKLTGAGKVTDLRSYRDAVPSGLANLRPDYIMASTQEALGKAPLFNKVKEYILDDGKMDSDEAKTVRESLSYEELFDLTNNPTIKSDDNVRTPLRNQMVQILNTTSNDNLQWALKRSNLSDFGSMTDAGWEPNPEFLDNLDKVISRVQTAPNLPDWSKKETVKKLKALAKAGSDWGGAYATHGGKGPGPGGAVGGAARSIVTTPYTTQAGIAQQGASATGAAVTRALGGSAGKFR